jgi:hypothetical protein
LLTHGRSDGNGIPSYKEILELLMAAKTSLEALYESTNMAKSAVRYQSQRNQA